MAYKDTNTIKWCLAVRISQTCRLYWQVDETNTEDTKLNFAIVTINKHLYTLPCDTTIQPPSMKYKEVCDYLYPYCIIMTIYQISIAATNYYIR